MAAIVWNDAFLTGLEEIDAQHKTLVSMINLLHEAHAAGQEKEIISDIVNGLSDYVQQHFADEERFMADKGCPHSAEHLRQHQDFSNQAMEFLLGFVQDKADLGDEVLNYLSGWLSGHILGTDMRMARMLLDGTC